MTAQPVPVRLTVLTATEAEERGLVTARQAAEFFCVSRPTLVRWIATAHIAPVGVLLGKRSGPRLPLYSRTQILRAANSVAVDATVRRRRSHPPKRVGTATPSAGRPYVWRDRSRTDD